MFPRLKILELAATDPAVMLNCVKGKFSRGNPYRHHKPLGMYRNTVISKTLNTSTPALSAEHRKYSSTESEENIIIGIDGMNSKRSPFWYMKQLMHTPAPALVYGVGGAIPFVSVPLYMNHLSKSGEYLPSLVDSLVHCQVSYGACILSFVGAVTWGYILKGGITNRINFINLGYSVTPALVAWLALLMPPPYSIVTLMSGFIGAGYIDVKHTTFPPWYKVLRILLTTTVVLSLCFTTVYRYKLKSKPSRQEESADVTGKQGLKEDEKKAKDIDNTKDEI